jgi:ribosomal protein S17
MKAKVLNIIDKNTIKVVSSTYKKHPRYGKYVTVYKKYLVETLGSDVAVGQEVVIKNSKPISSSKKWILTN